MSTKKPITDAHNYLASYEFHGVFFGESNNSNEGISDCPYCGKESHFFVNSSTGQHECKVCGESGNLYSFLQKIYDDALSQTGREDYKSLSSLRNGLPWQAFQEAKLAYSQSLDRWYIPIKNFKGALADIRSWFDFNGRRQLMTTPGCSTHLFNANLLAEAPSTAAVYLVEGEWDAIALQWLFRKNHVPTHTYCVVGSPGANTFKRDWIKQFQSRKVIRIYDNDTAGMAGGEKVDAKLQGVAESVTPLLWPAEGLPKGYDLRDFICERVKSPKRCLGGLRDLISASQATLEIHNQQRPKSNLVRETFDSVVEDFAKTIHMTPNFRDSLLVTMATAISVLIPGDNVWLFLVGPPGCGKSLCINSFQQLPMSIFLSKLSAQALVSGYRTADGSDPSILGKLRNMCLFVKDYTAIKGMPITVQEELYGILRDAFDKHVRIVFGNGEIREYRDLSFSMVAGVTDVIHGDNRATLGERFLKFEMLPEDYDPDAQIRAAIDTVVDTALNEELMQESVYAFLSHKIATLTSENLPEVPSWVSERIVALTRIGSYLRAVVHRGSGRDLIHRPRPEVGTRLGKQLTKAARSIAYILGKPAVDMEVHRIVEKLAIDTVVGWSLEMVQFLVRYLEQHNQGATSLDIATELQVSSSFVGRKMQDLQELRVVESHIDRTGKRGRSPTVWTLNPDFLSIWRRSKLGIGERETPSILRKRIRHFQASGKARKKITTTKKVRRKK